MSDKANVFIVVPVHNRVEHTIGLLNSLRKQTYKQFKLIIIDDGSTDGTELRSRELFPDLICLKGNGNLWWAGSLQKAYDWLKEHSYTGDMVLILNDDTALDDKFIETGVNFLLTRNRTLLCAQGVNIKTGLEQDSGGYRFDFKKLTFDETYVQNEINCLSTRGLILKVSDFIEIGGFYPRLLPHYLSDLEYTFRACKKGFKLATIPEFRIHINFETTGIKDIRDEKFIVLLKKMFSKKYSGNPIYWTVFILLCSPRKLVLKNVYRVWRDAYRLVVINRFLPAISRRIKNIRKFV